MSASVRDLLDGIHARAWELAGAELPAAGEAREAGAAGLLVVWPRLAASTLRALDAVPLAASKQDDVAAVRDSLAEVVDGRVSWRELRWSVEQPVPDREVLGIAVRVGAIADLLVGQPRARLDGDEAGFGLQANLLAPVFAVATTTLAALEGLPVWRSSGGCCVGSWPGPSGTRWSGALTGRAGTTMLRLRLLVRCRWMARSAAGFRRPRKLSGRGMG